MCFILSDSLEAFDLKIVKICSKERQEYVCLPAGVAFWVSVGLALFCPGLLSLKLPNTRWCRKSHPLVHRESECKSLFQYANSFLRMCSAPNPDYVSISHHKVNDIRHRPAITECQVQQEHERLVTWKTGVSCERGPGVVNRKGTIHSPCVLISSSFHSLSPQSQRTWAQRSAPSWRRSGAEKERCFLRSRDWKRSWEKPL